VTATPTTVGGVSVRFADDLSRSLRRDVRRLAEWLVANPEYAASGLWAADEPAEISQRDPAGDLIRPVAQKLHWERGGQVIAIRDGHLDIVLTRAQENDETFIQASPVPYAQLGKRGTRWTPAGLPLLPVLGGVAVLAAVIAAVAVTPPDPVPNWALESNVVYRIEILIAVLAGLYVTAAVFYSSLNNRLVTRLSAAGASVEFATAETSEGLEELSRAHEELADAVGEIAAQLDDRVRKLEEEGS